MSEVEVGEVEAIYCYPVKSMRGQLHEEAALGWNGIAGDRRFALRRVDQRGDFPWLNASKFAELLLYAPIGTFVRTPGGAELPMFDAALAEDVAARYGAPVEMMQWKNGIFDDACVSVITSSTVDQICRLASCPPDARRFRPNIVVRSARGVAFEEDAWVGGVLAFGDGADAPSIAVTKRDERCMMVGLDPDDASSNPEMMKALVRANDKYAGIYGTITRIGQLAVGQRVMLRRETP